MLVLLFAANIDLFLLVLFFAVMFVSFQVTFYHWEDSWEVQDKVEHCRCQAHIYTLLQAWYWSVGCFPLNCWMIVFPIPVHVHLGIPGGDVVLSTPTSVHVHVHYPPTVLCCSNPFLCTAHHFMGVVVLFIPIPVHLPTYSNIPGGVVVLFISIPVHLPTYRIPGVFLRWFLFGVLPMLGCPVLQVWPAPVVGGINNYFVGLTGTNTKLVFRH